MMEKMIPDERDRILFVCINNSIDCPNNGSIYDRRNDLKEATRKYWPVAKDKRNKITCCVACPWYSKDGSEGFVLHHLQRRQRLLRPSDIQRY